MPRRGRTPPAPKTIGRNMPVSSGSGTKSSPVVQSQMSPALPVSAPVATQQPSLFKQMVATAGGVAIGSAVGHTVGAGITNMLDSKGSDQANSAADLANLKQTDTETNRNIEEPCSSELRQFLHCSQIQTDITLCQGFNEALRQCKAHYGV